MKHWWLIPILLLGFLVRKAGFETQDEKTRFSLYEPDEYQHQQLAKLQLATLLPKIYKEDEVPRSHFNARGFGYHLGLLLWFKHSREAPDNRQIIMTGRYLSTFFSICTIIVVFLFCNAAFGLPTAIFSSFLLAVNDLNTNYSHYALPEVPYVFWLYLFLFSVWLYFKKASFLSTVLLFFSAMGAFTYKFDFICLFLSFGVLLWPKTKHAFSLITRLGIGVVLSLFFFQLLCLFNFSFEDLIYSWNELRNQNQDAIPQDNHWVHNPVIYFVGIIAAVGIPCFLSAVAGGIRWKKEWHSFSSATTATIVVFAGLLVLEIGARWAVDTPFVRRLGFIMPAFCILAGYQLAFWWQQKRSEILSVGVLLYGLAYLIASQINHWQDPRYAAIDYIVSEFPEQDISFSAYTKVIGGPKGKKIDDASIYVMNESYYSRFGKSFTTPFKIPQCCEEVYHCFRGEEVCLFHQKLLDGTNPDFTLVKAFRTKEIFPERIFFHYLFGHFETFRGDVLIFKRNT